MIRKLPLGKSQRHHHQQMKNHRQRKRPGSGQVAEDNHLFYTNIPFKNFEESRTSS
jgi:hypothetical protein